MLESEAFSVRPVRFYLGAVWNPDSAVWRDFFPADLPADWRLPYWVHFWPDLLLPELLLADCVAAAPETEGPPEGLRLYLELAAPRAPAQVFADCPQGTLWAAAVMAQLVGKGGRGAPGQTANAAVGLVYPDPQVLAIPGAAQAVGYRPAVRLAGGPAPSEYPSASASFASASLTAKGQEESTAAPEAPMLWRVKPEDALELPGWRDLLTALATATQAGSAVLFLDASPAQLATVATLLRLMGLEATRYRENGLESSLPVLRKR